MSFWRGSLVPFFSGLGYTPTWRERVKNFLGGHVFSRCVPSESKRLTVTVSRVTTCLSPFSPGEPPQGCELESTRWKQLSLAGPLWCIMHGGRTMLVQSAQLSFLTQLPRALLQTLHPAASSCGCTVTLLSSHPFTPVIVLPRHTLAPPGIWMNVLPAASLSLHQHGPLRSARCSRLGWALCAVGSAQSPSGPSTCHVYCCHHTGWLLPACLSVKGQWLGVGHCISSLPWGKPRA